MSEEKWRSIGGTSEVSQPNASLRLVSNTILYTTDALKNVMMAK